MASKADRVRLDRDVGGKHERRFQIGDVRLNAVSLVTVGQGDGNVGRMAFP